MDKIVYYKGDGIVVRPDVMARVGLTDRQIVDEPIMWEIIRQNALSMADEYGHEFPELANDIRRSCLS